MTEQSETVGDSSHPPLSRLDVDVLRLVAQGLSFSEIGQLARVSQSLVGRQVLRLMTLLGARDRADLVAKAEENGLI
ncbi:helix-turn-helix transcriptional regulator [Streptomyces sp. NPDC126497]|uniref:response regulator transcription factor n=1 Tax=Streptomyces sp. NPDC126497 TaxID=3155313 RepID=UPI0033286322